jgi:CheY-like chemotaxis protein
MAIPKIFKILLAEDDEIDVELMRRAFQDAKVEHHLMVVRDGQAAIDFLSDLAKRHDETAPALVLLDMKMPRRSGLEVLRWMKADDGLRCIPVMIFSASGLPRDVEPAYASGAAVYIVKPSSLKERAEIAGFIVEWLTLAAAPLAVMDGVKTAAAFMSTWLRVRPNRLAEGGAS